MKVPNSDQHEARLDSVSDSAIMRKSRSTLGHTCVQVSVLADQI